MWIGCELRDMIEPGRDSPLELIRKKPIEKLIFDFKPYNRYPYVNNRSTTFQFIPFSEVDEVLQNVKESMSKNTNFMHTIEIRATWTYRWDSWMTEAWKVATFFPTRRFTSIEFLVREETIDFIDFFLQTLPNLRSVKIRKHHFNLSTASYKLIGNSLKHRATRTSEEFHPIQTLSISTEEDGFMALLECWDSSEYNTFPTELRIIGYQYPDESFSTIGWTSLKEFLLSQDCPIQKFSFFGRTPDDNFAVRCLLDVIKRNKNIKSIETADILFDSSAFQKELYNILGLAQSLNTTRDSNHKIEDIIMNWDLVSPYYLDVLLQINRHYSDQQAFFKKFLFSMNNFVNTTPDEIHIMMRFFDTAARILPYDQQRITQTKLQYYFTLMKNATLLPNIENIARLIQNNRNKLSTTNAIIRRQQHNETEIHSQHSDQNVPSPQYNDASTYFNDNSSSSGDSLFSSSQDSLVLPTDHYNATALNDQNPNEEQDQIMSENDNNDNNSVLSSSDDSLFSDTKSHDEQQDEIMSEHDNNSIKGDDEIMSDCN